MEQAAGHVTGFLLAWGEGSREALDQLMPLVYAELRPLVLGTSTTSAWRDWNTARTWLYDALSAS